MSSVDRRQIELEECRKRFPLFAAAVSEIVLTPFHLKYYRILHRFAKGEIKRLIITVPPQHGKSLGSTILLPSFMLGRNPDLSIAIASYSTVFARRFNRSIQRIIDSPIYSDIFPETNLSSGRDGYKRDTDEFEIISRKGSLKAVGRGGALTGNKVDVMILDDIYKDRMEGNSPVIRDAVWDWYTSVVKTRLHNDSQELIVFTRWHEDDLIGLLERKDGVIEINSFSDIQFHSDAWHKINFEAIKTKPPTELDPRNINQPLWGERHSYDLLIGKKALDPHTFDCMYQGNPSAKEGYLYSQFKTYQTLPDKIIKYANYTDTADTGNDYLCSVCYVVGSDDKIYITDVLYTDEPMEVTEPLTAQMLQENEIRVSYIESNNGGRGFARNMAKLCPKINVQWFHQSGNKEARILSNSATVTQNIYFPEGWDKQWTKFYGHLITYKRVFNANKNDDAPDVLTGIVEKEVKISKSKIIIA